MHNTCTVILKQLNKIFTFKHEKSTKDHILIVSSLEEVATTWKNRKNNNDKNKTGKNKYKIK